MVVTVVRHCEGWQLAGVVTQARLEQYSVGRQLPRLPPQPSLPQVPEKGVQWQRELALQALLRSVALAQPPQEPLQPLLPHVLPVQSPTQVQTPLRHWSLGPVQVPQLPPQPSSPHTPAPLGQKGVQWHWELELQALRS